MGPSTEVRASQSIFVQSTACQSVTPLYPACTTQQYTTKVAAYGDSADGAIANLNQQIDLYVCASVGGRGGSVSVQKCERQSEVAIEVVPARKGVLVQSNKLAAQFMRLLARLPIQLKDWATSLI